MNIFCSGRSRYVRGYIALGLAVSSLFFMLVAVADLGQWAVFVNTHINRYEDVREVYTLIYSCVAIMQTKIVAEEILAEDVEFQTRSGTCEVHTETENQTQIQFLVEAIGRDVTLPGRVNLEKTTGEIIDFVVL